MKRESQGRQLRLEASTSSPKLGETEPLGLRLVRHPTNRSRGEPGRVAPPSATRRKYASFVSSATWAFFGENAAFKLLDRDLANFRGHAVPLRSAASFGVSTSIMAGLTRYVRSSCLLCFALP